MRTALISLLIILIVFYQYFLDHKLNEHKFGQILSGLINIFWSLSIISIIAVLILENHNPTKTLSWIIVFFFLPLVGLILYFVFGKNVRKSKIYNKKETEDYLKIEHLVEIEDDYHGDIEYALSQNNLIRQVNKLLENNNKAFLTHRNSIEVYCDGVDAIDAICEEIDKAKESVHFQFYIIRSDETGELVKKHLIKKAGEGVQVRVLYDAVGSWTLTKEYIESLRQGGVEVVPFSPVKFPFISSKLNYRNHRKIVVIDGKVGFVGGINISDKYRHKPKYWRDTHLRLKGDAVHSLQAIFANDWLFSTGKDLFVKSYFPQIEEKQLNPIQIISSGPDSNWDTIMQGYFAMISSAEEYIHITTPYLILNESLLTAIKVAALSGIEVKIIVPGEPDHNVVYWASRSYYKELLRSGVRLYEYQNGFIHSKILSVDGIVTTIGSANMDIRSFIHNFEVNAVIYSMELTEKMNKIFLEDMSNSKELSLEDLKKRKVLEKMRDSTARLFSPLL
ncbi:MAG: cardiolipin synthase [Candidatus Cloacimonas sp.]|nr:cardiolipin synthase [Candidatus Cloacimonadota bacterium]